MHVKQSFQSTLPAGGATALRRFARRSHQYFNPRSPRGERPSDRHQASLLAKFQSTLPAGGATQRLKSPYGSVEFQSTLPAGGATVAFPNKTRSLTYFNPRSPRGERLDCVPIEQLYGTISIHAPRGGSDVIIRSAVFCCCLFQSTLPAGGATLPQLGRHARLMPFQSTLPAGGATYLTLISSKFW